MSIISISGEEIIVLTKDLVRYKIFKDTISPMLIQTNDPQLLRISTQLLALFNDSIGKTRGTLIAESKNLIDHFVDNTIVARGLEKLLMDRTTFNTDSPESLIQFRQDLFLFTSKLHQESIQDLETYYQTIEQNFQQDMSHIQNQLYSDLPNNQPVIGFKAFSAERLLHRYNCAQVQGLLLHCSQLILKILNPDTARLRQLFKYIRFHQLLANISKLKEENGFHIQIDGPLNLFIQTKKYGLNLANFFPAILNQKEWQLTAQIKLKKRKNLLELSLDHNCNILSHYNQFMAYIPDEITMIQKNFNKKISSWQIQPSETLIPLPGDTWCFPDFTLTNQHKDIFHLELFHAWHSTPLIYRLNQLKSVQSSGLLLGVSKKLLKDPAIKKVIEESKYFRTFGFVFNDMPTVSHIRSVIQIDE
jgi:hypothetical protein